jgi:hypothetical protein
MVDDADAIELQPVEQLPELPVAVHALPGSEEICPATEAGADAECCDDDRPIFDNETERYFWTCERIAAGRPVTDRDGEFKREYEADPFNRVNVELMRKKLVAGTAIPDDQGSKNKVGVV